MVANTVNTVVAHLLNQTIAILRRDHETLSMQINDVRRQLARAFVGSGELALKTDAPVAVWSNDHQHPWGTKNDNHRRPQFVKACVERFGAFSLLDLGCSGGGLVYDALSAGYLGVGVEGSDYSLRAQRGEWAVIPDHLFTGDITKPFEVTRAGQPQKFHVVTLWEVWEHIPEDKMAAVFDNIDRHLTADGHIVGSIGLTDDVVDGVSYHPTVKPVEWWRDAFRSFGFEFAEDPYALVPFDAYLRGVGNGPMDPSYRQDPKAGFHFVAARSKA
jgi:SAM-dependent methyltransferase